MSWGEASRPCFTYPNTATKERRSGFGSHPLEFLTQCPA